MWKAWHFYIFMLFMIYSGYHPVEYQELANAN